MAESYTALILLFKGSPEKTNFKSRGFMLLWDMEKNIEKEMIREYMRYKPELRDRTVKAVPELAAYYWWISIVLNKYILNDIDDLL